MVNEPSVFELLMFYCISYRDFKNQKLNSVDLDKRKKADDKNYVCKLSKHVGGNTENLKTLLNLLTVKMLVQCTVELQWLEHLWDHEN